jgi:HK97 family phage major capsid protein
MNHNEKRLAAIEQKLGEKADAIEAIWKKAEKEEREPTEDERAEAGQLLEDSRKLQTDRKAAQDAVRIDEEVRDQARKFGAGQKDAEKPQTGEPARPKQKSMGDQFIESDAYKNQSEKGFRGEYATGYVELDVETKATLLEGDNLFSGGTPGAAAPFVPLDVRGGYLPILEQVPTVAALFGQATTSSNAVANVRETLATNNADVVAEGTAKPESALEYDLEQVPVKKIATWLPVSDELLSDAPAIRAIINNRLVLFVRQEEDAQLLHGAGGGNFLGLMPQVPAANRYLTSGVAAAQNADHIFAALTKARESFLEPDSVVINPNDWADLRLLKDGNENYIAGSPYSTGSGEPVERLWGKRLVVTQAIPEGTAVVGAFSQGATLFRNGGISVEATNSHEDFFEKNLTAIRAEERAALAVHRPSAFAIADIGYPS